MTILKKPSQKPNAQGALPKQEGLWGYARELMANPAFRWLFIITAILSYTFYVTHLTIDIDDLSQDWYMQGEVLAAGRFTWQIISAVFQLRHADPVFSAAFCLLLLMLALVLLCGLLRRATGRKLSIGACTAFCCLMISYPLLSESFSYSALVMSYGFGALLVAGALCCVQGSQRGRQIPALALASLLLMCAASLYEALIPAYVFLVMAMLLLRVRVGDEALTGVKAVLLEGLRYALPMVIGMALASLVSNAILTLLDIHMPHTTANQIFWLTQPFWECVKSIVRGFLYQNVIRGLFYFPIGILLVSMVGMLGFAIGDTVRLRKASVPLLYAGLFFCLVILSVVQGGPSLYRMQFVFAFFVAFLGMLVVQSALAVPKGAGRYALVGLVALLVFYQANSLNHYFTVNHLRYENERMAADQIGHRLKSEFDTSKPVAFVGNYNANLGSEYYQNATVTDPQMVETVNRLREQIGLKRLDILYIQESVNYSYLNWAIDALDDGLKVYKFFSRYGYDFIPASEATRMEAKGLEAEMPGWPAQGSIVDTGEYLVVSLGKW